MKTLHPIITAAVLAACAGQALADRIVIRSNDDPSTDFFVAPNTPIVLGVPAGVTRINIFSDRTNNQSRVSCPLITLNPSGSDRTVPLRVIMASDTFPSQPVGPTTFGLQRLGGFEATGTLRDWTAVNITVVEATGSFKAGLIGRFDARVPSGFSVDVHGYAPALSGPVFGIDNFAVAGVLVSDMVGSIIAESGSIMQVDVNGTFTGSIKADAGKVGSVSVPFGSMMTYSLIRARDGIDYINTGPNSSFNTYIANYLNTSGTGQMRSFVGPSFPTNSSLVADKIVGELFNGTNGFSSSSCYGAVTILGDVTSTISFSNAGTPGGAIPDFFIGGNVLQNFTMTGGQRGKILIQGNFGSPSAPRTMNLYTFTELKTANVYGDVNFKTAPVQTVPINHTGDVAGTLTFEQGLQNLVRIGGSVTGSGPGIRVLPANGLVGQVIIGANGVSGASISRVVEVGPTGSSITLSPFPAYTQTSASLGGGALGVAPFLMHAVDCKPTQPSTPPGSVAGLAQVHKGAWDLIVDTISAQFYGPLLVAQSADTDVDPALLGITVWYCPLSTFDPAYVGNVDVTSKFKARVPFGTYNRRIFIRPKCTETYLDGSNNIGGIYKVTNSVGGTYGNSLRCRFVGTPGAEPKVDTFGLYFRFWCSDVDFGQQGGIPGGDGNLDNNDFIVFFDYFYAQNALADLGSTGGVPAPDGAWDNNDFVVFIDKFYAGCDPFAKTCFGGGEGGGAGGGLPSEQSMACASTSTAGSLTESQRQRELEALLAAYQATGDIRVLERLNALSVGSDR